MPKNPAKINSYDYDCIIVGGGIAGLSAATILSRALRKVLIVDDGHQSNRVSKKTHNLFTRDGASPDKIYRIAQQQLSRFPEIVILKGKVVEVNNENNGFEVILVNKKKFKSKSVLLAQGINYQLPNISGMQELWGVKAWHCPYCDGLESRGKKLIAIGDAAWIEHMSIILPTWSRNITWSSTGGTITPNLSARIKNAGGSLAGKVVKVQQSGAGVTAILENGRSVKAYRIVIETISTPRDEIASKLMCKTESTGHVVIDEYGKTTIAGVYSCGDESSVLLQQAGLAAASGHTAAIGINLYLSQLDRANE